MLTTYPGSTVVTVLAGRPPAYPAQVPDWDASRGFAGFPRRGTPALCVNPLTGTRDGVAPAAAKRRAVASPIP